MKSVKFSLLFFVFLLLVISVSALEIIPGELVFDNVLDYGYAEKTIEVSSDNARPFQITLSATEPLNSWITFEPESGYVDNGHPAQFKVILNPYNASIGTYKGYIILNTRSEGNRLTTSVATAFDVRITLKITEDQITEANIVDVILDDIEVNSPLNVSAVIENKGNTQLSPYFQVHIFDVNKQHVLQSFTSEQNTLLPSSRRVIDAEISNTLPVGKYYADITLRSGEMLLRKHILSFFVVEPGMISAKEEKGPIVVYPDPIPLGMSWMMLLVWGLILAFVVWTISKNKPKKSSRKSR